MDLLDKMATYVRVIEAGSFSAAAQQLRLSAAAVSRQIAALEGELRVTLLRRSTRRMAITPAGRLYYERCLRILREVDEAQAIGRGDAVDGLLQVSAPVTFGLARVVPHLRSLLSAHPGLRIDLRLEDRLVDLVVEDVDVAIRVGSPAPDRADVVAQKLLVYPRVIVASPEYLKRRGEPKTPEALAKHDAVTNALDAAARSSWTLGSEGREVRARVNVVFASNAPYALRELALAGAGLALLPRFLVADDVRRGTLRNVLPSWQTEPVTANAIFRSKHKEAPRIRMLIEHLRRAYAAEGP